MEQALREADRLLDMFGALLRIARIEAGGRREGFQNIDIGQILSRTFEMYKPLMDDTAHSFEIVIAERATVPGDPQMLLQLLTNLLDNAINHTPSGTGVTGWAGIEGGLPTLVIADTGPGIPQADRTRVFRRFFRLEQSRTSPGSGLGLSLVAAIAETHGAQIELGDNAPGTPCDHPFSGAHHGGGRRRAGKSSAPDDPIRPGQSLILPNLSSPRVHRTESDPPNVHSY